MVHQTVDEEELEDVQQHPPQRDLQGAQVGVGREEGDQTQGAEDVSDGEDGLRHQGGVPHFPLVPGSTATVLKAEDGEGEEETTPEGSSVKHGPDSPLCRLQSSGRWWPNIRSS